MNCGYDLCNLYARLGYPLLLFYRFQYRQKQCSEDADDSDDDEQFDEGETAGGARQAD
jgi:hypothetical protein